MLVDAKGSISTPESEQVYKDLANGIRDRYALGEPRDYHFWVQGYTDKGFQGREIYVEVKGQKDPLIHIRRVQGATGTTTIQLRHNIVTKYGNLEWSWGRSSLRVDTQDAQIVGFDELAELDRWLERPDMDKRGVELFTRLERLQTP